MDTDFSPERLRRLLATRAVTWRHDVDYVPECAVEMAELENSLGIQATYYLRPNGYDLRDLLLDLGHDVGVHVDLGLPRDAHVPPSLLAARTRLAYHELQPNTRRVSFHAPPRSVYWQWVPGFEHAMGPEWQGRTISDSRGVWRQSPERFLAQVPDAQVNAHPEWWWLPPAEAEVLRERELAAP